MNSTRILALVLTLCFIAPFAASQAVPPPVHQRFEGWCDSLQNAELGDLVQFLNAVVPDERNSRCVTWAIHKLGKERYEPAITPLVRLLDFRRPETEGEKIFHGFDRETFPAEEALELIGNKALPDVLRIIESDTSSDTSRRNALNVWMELYRQSDENPKGVADLKSEESKVNDSTTKQRLQWAVRTAVTHCNPNELADCQRAAAISTP